MMPPHKKKGFKSLLGTLIWYKIHANYENMPTDDGEYKLLLKHDSW